MLEYMYHVYGILNLSKMLHYQLYSTCYTAVRINNSLKSTKVATKKSSIMDHINHYRQSGIGISSTLKDLQWQIISFKSSSYLVAVCNPFLQE